MYPVSLLFGFTIAGFSELIQLFTPGRGCSWIDVGIDTLGYAVGVAIIALIFLTTFIVKFIKEKKLTQKKTD